MKKSSWSKKSRARVYDYKVKNTHLAILNFKLRFFDIYYYFFFYKNKTFRFFWKVFDREVFIKTK